MDRLNYINSGNAAYINSLYEAYKQEPESVDFGWQKFFEGFDFGKEDRVPDGELNEVIWVSVKGNTIAFPGPTHAAFVKLNKKKDDD